MNNTVCILLMLLAFSICGIRISKGIQFKQNVTGYLKRAADASTIKLAEEELTKALNFLEENEITTGYTSILYETPEEDIDFWYRNLKASQSELRNLESESVLEKTNLLIKLRETLLDTGEKARVTVPDGIAVYPDNKFWGIMMSIALVLGSIGFTVFLMNEDKKSKAKAAANAEK